MNPISKACASIKEAYSSEHFTYSLNSAAILSFDEAFIKFCNSFIFVSNAVSSLVSFISSGRQITLDSVVANCSDSSIADDLKYVISTAQAVSGGAYKVEYSPNLVRGQGYYTGMVFEIASPAFSGAVGGGGRYDNMIGKFIG